MGWTAHERRVIQSNMTDGKPKVLLTATETAAIIGIDRKTLRLWVRSGKCPIAPIPGMTPHRWHRADVDAWVSGGAL